MLVALKIILKPSGILLTILENKNFRPKGERRLLCDKSRRFKCLSWESSPRSKENFSAKSSLTLRPLKLISLNYLSLPSIK